MTGADYFDSIQKIYIAFYQRPADPAGLRYWAEQAEAAEGNLSHIIDAFAASPEAVGLYGSVIDDATIGAVIDSLYLALFNRAPDALGRQFYIDGFGLGVFSPGSIALAVLRGAQGADDSAIAHKLQVANEFTQQVDGRPWSFPGFGTDSRFDVTYVGDADVINARAILAGVTAQPSTVLTPAQVTAVLMALIADPGDAIFNNAGGGGDSGGGGGGDAGGGGGDTGGGGGDAGGGGGDTGGGDDPPAPSTHALTVNEDTVVGGAGDDTVTGTGATFTSGDNINGGGGRNTLRLTQDDSGGLSLPTDVVVQNMQVLDIVNTAGAVAVDVQSWGGLQQVRVQQGDAAAGVQIDTQGNASTVEITGGAQAFVFDDGDEVDAGADVLASVVLTDGGQSGQMSYVGSDALTQLSLVRWLGDAYVVSVPGERTLILNGLADVTLSDEQATALQVMAQGAASTGIRLIAPEANPIHFGGDQSLSLYLNALGGQASGLVITSNNTAGVTILNQLGNDTKFTGGDGNDTVTLGATTQAINMGAGDDTVYVTALLEAGGTLDGGAGEDTLVMSSAVAASLTGGGSNDDDEPVDDDDDDDDDDFDFDSVVSGFETLRMADVPADANDTIDMDRLGNPELLVLTGVAAGGTLTVDKMLSGGTLELTGALLGSVTVQMAAESGEDSLDIKLNGVSQTNHSGVLTVSGANYLDIKATHSGTDSPTAPSALKLNAGGAQTIWVSGSHGIDFTGSTFGADCYLDASGLKVAGAMGAMVVDNSASDDALRVKGGAGNDTIVLGAGDDWVESSEGADTITFGDGTNVYALQKLGHSSALAPDVITDFDVGTNTIQIRKSLTEKPDDSGALIKFNVNVVGGDSDIANKLSEGAADALNTINVVLDSTTGLLYLDVNDDGLVDSVIKLTGVTVITAAVFEISLF